MTMLTIPLVFVDLSSDRVSVQENRMLAARPKLADIKNHPGTFIRGFDAWFKDSTGFRKQLLAMYRFIEINSLTSGFRYKDGKFVFLVGEQGHHYFAGIDGSLIPVFQGKKILYDNQLMAMAERLEAVKTYLDSKGIPFVVMFCTKKESIYPEFYPKSIKPGPEPIQLDMITGYLKEHTSVDVFNIRQALLAEKNNYLLYPVSGDMNALAHCTMTGGFFAYRELMRHINVYLPKMIPYELNDDDIEYDEKMNPVVSLKVKASYKKLTPSFFDDVNYDYNFLNAAFENTDPNLPVILLLRDSYMNEEFIGKYVAQDFNKTVMINFLNMEHFEEYITRYKPDIVVFEAVEYQLGIFADSVAKIPELP
jgi:hypothetical protein